MGDLTSLLETVRTLKDCLQPEFTYSKLPALAAMTQNQRKSNLTHSPKFAIFVHPTYDGKDYALER